MGSKKGKPKQVDFLFVYEVKARELENISLLRYELERRGYTVAFLNSWHCLQHDYQAYVANVVVISAAYNSGLIEYFTGHAQQYEKVVDMQWEQVWVNWAIGRNSDSPWKTEGIAKYTQRICWGEHTKERQKSNYDVDETYLPVLGYLPLDFYNPLFEAWFIPKKTLYKRYKLDFNRKTCLFVSSLSYVNASEDYVRYVNNDIAKEMTEICTASQRLIVEWALQMLNEQTEVQFVYRPHPAEQKSELLAQAAGACDRFHVIGGEAIKHWIHASDTIYNWNSTSIIEMYFSKKPTFLLRPISLPQQYDFSLFEGGTIVSDYNGFLQSVQQDEAAFPIDINNLLQHYRIGTEPCYLRISDFLEKTLRTNEYRGPHSYAIPAMVERKNINLLHVWKNSLVIWRNRLVVRKINLYTSFWNSQWNQKMIEKAKINGKTSHFWEVRRTADQIFETIELPPKRQKATREEKRKKRKPVKTLQEQERKKYEQTMGKRNYANQWEVFCVLRRIKRMLEK